MTLESSLFPPSSVNILVFLGLVCCWLQPTRKLSENYQFFCIRLSRLGILLLLSTNEPVVVNSCHLYDAKLNFFYSFFLWLCIKLYVHPFMKGHGLYMNKTSINHMHTHTKQKTKQKPHTLQIHALLVMNWYNEKKMTDQHAEEKRWVFSFDLSEWRRMPDWKRK